MNGVFQIRMATQADAEAIHAITREAFTKYCEMAGIPDIEALRETVDDVRRDIGEKTVIVAYLGETVVGSLRLTFDDATKTVYVSRFGVSRSYRNIGIGKSLSNVADMLAHSRGMERARLHTAAKLSEIVRFYYSRGYYIEAVSGDRGYLRADMVKEYT